MIAITTKETLNFYNLKEIKRKGTEKLGQLICVFDMTLTLNLTKVNALQLFQHNKHGSHERIPVLSFRPRNAFKIVIRMIRRV